jgi:hypothetical protein
MQSQEAGRSLVAALAFLVWDVLITLDDEVRSSANVLLLIMCIRAHGHFYSLGCALMDVSSLHLHSACLSNH